MVGGPPKPARNCKCLATPTGPSASAASRAAWDWAVGLGAGGCVLPPPAACTRCDVCRDPRARKGSTLCLHSSARAYCMRMAEHRKIRSLQHVHSPSSCLQRVSALLLLHLSVLCGCSGLRDWSTLSRTERILPHLVCRPTCCAHALKAVQERTAVRLQPGSSMPPRGCCWLQCLRLAQGLLLRLSCPGPVALQRGVA
jgi:hypothetical protein